jgi:hypothetical protein
MWEKFNMYELLSTKRTINRFNNWIYLPGYGFRRFFLHVLSEKHVHFLTLPSLPVTQETK